MYETELKLWQDAIKTNKATREQIVHALRVNKDALTRKIAKMQAEKEKLEILLKAL